MDSWGRRRVGSEHRQFRFFVSQSLGGGQRSVRDDGRGGTEVRSGSGSRRRDVVGVQLHRGVGVRRRRGGGRLVVHWWGEARGAVRSGGDVHDGSLGGGADVGGWSGGGDGQKGRRDR